MTPKTLSKKIANALYIKKGYDVTIIDLRKVTSMTDFFVLCSVDSDTQARAVADSVEDELKLSGERPVRTEGYKEGRWVLLDYVDVVVHVLHKEMRTFYNLEKLWSDGKIEYVADPQDVTKPSRKGTKPAKKK